MNIIDIIFLAIALAMDCFTVSIVSGVIIGKWTAAPMLRMCFLFGLFQALMPLVGWLGISFFSASLESVDHWLAFGLLAFIGGKMVKESFEENDEAHPHFNPSRLRTQLMLSVATSIDALAVGISFGCLGYTSLSSISVPLFVIGIKDLNFEEQENIIKKHIAIEVILNMLIGKSSKTYKKYFSKTN